MAGIGDEIDPHLFRCLGAAAVRQMHHFLTRTYRLDTHVPHLALLADTGQADGVAGMLRVGVGQALDGTGMPEGHPHILADDIVAKQLPCDLIGGGHTRIINYQDRIGRGIDKGLQLRVAGNGAGVDSASRRCGRCCVGFMRVGGDKQCPQHRHQHHQYPLDIPGQLPGNQRAPDGERYRKQDFRG